MPDQKNLPFYRRRWSAMLAAVAVFILLLLTLLPHAISYGMHKWLLEHGGDDVQIGDIDINLFTGRASVENLQLYAGGEAMLTIPHLAADLDWRPLFSRQVVLRHILVDGVRLSVEVAADGHMRVGGIETAKGGEETKVDAGSQWHLGVEVLEISNTTINYLAQDLQLETRLDELLLSGIRTWATDDAPLKLSGALNGAQLVLDGSLPPLSKGFGYRGSVQIGSLDLGAFAALAQAAVGELAGQLSIDTRLDVLQLGDDPLTVKQSGMIRFDDLNLTLQENRVALGSLQWDGETAVTATDTPVVSAGGRLEYKQLALDVAGNDTQLARIEDMQMDRLELQETGALAVENIKWHGIALARADAPDSRALLSAGTVSLDSLQLDAGNIILGKLHGEDVEALIRREADGAWEIAKLVESLPFGRAEEEAGPAETEVAAAQQPAGQLRVDEVGISGNSSIELQDATVRPAFKTRLSLDKVALGSIDSMQPAQDSPVSVEARTGKHSRISVKGTIRPFAERPTLVLENQLEAIALTDISPYTISTLGYALKSGHLDADANIRIDAGKLEGDNKLTLRALEVEPVDNDAREQFDSQLSVPLGTALNMLRDKHDTIYLDLPVSGDIENPEFDISDVVNTAVGKALKKGSMAYLTQALQPYGTLITLARLAGEAASKVRLDPVPFDAGSAQRPDDRTEYLGKVAGILAERPELNIKVCGVANEQDRMAMSARAASAAAAEKKDGKAAEAPVEPVTISDGQLLALATERAGTITDYLVSSHAVSASRLVACQPSIDSSADGKPRVDLLL